MGDQLTYNLADQWEAVSDRVADREAVVCGSRRLTYAQLEERANRLANHLASAGVGPGDLVGCYLLNGTEYLETMLAAFKIRAVPVNINYRYVDRRAAAPARRLGLGRCWCATTSSCPAWPRSRRRSLRCARRWSSPGRRGRDSTTPGCPSRSTTSSALAAASPERPVVAGPRRRRHLRALHRRHHGPAQGRGVAHGRHVLRLHRRRRPDAAVGPGLVARGEPRAHHRLRLRASTRCAPLMHAARAVGLDDVAALRRARSCCTPARSIRSSVWRPSTPRRCRR